MTLCSCGKCVLELLTANGSHVWSAPALVMLYLIKLALKEGCYPHGLSGDRPPHTHTSLPPFLLSNPHPSQRPPGKPPVQPPRFIRRNWRRTGGGCTLFPVTLPHRGSQGGCFKTKTKNLGFDSRLHVHTHTHSHPHTHSVTQAWKNIEYEFPLSSISMNKPTYT